MFPATGFALSSIRTQFRTARLPGPTIVAFITLVLAIPAGAGSPATVPITNAWLQERGSGPYLLNKPNTVYRLDTDVQTQGTAFVVGAANVVLDLNKHVVTYGNSVPIAVRNGGFEEGSSPTDVPGWDLTGAPGALRKPARVG